MFGLIKKLSLLLVRSYFGPFLVTFLVAMFVFEMQFVWVYLDDLIGKGIGIGVIFKLLIYASARIVNMALPLAILMSSIMTLGSLAENNELTAMKGAGISLFRIMRPLIVFSIVISMASFLFANNIWPIANLKFRTLLFSVIQQRPALNLEDGVFYNGIEGISIRVMKKNTETGELSDIIIYDHRQKTRGNRTVIRAKSGTMDQTEDKRFLIMNLYDGYSYDEQEEKNKNGKSFPMVMSHFEKSTLRMDLSAFAFQAKDEEVFKNSFEMMTISQLNRTIDSLANRLDSTRIRLTEANLQMLHTQSMPNQKVENVAGLENKTFESLSARDKQKVLGLARDNTRKNVENIERQKEEIQSRAKFLNRHRIEWHRKFTLSAACLILFFVGAPLGAIIRKGGLGIPTVIALMLFIVFQLVSIAGEKMAKGMILDASVGMWIGTAVMFPLSIWLTYKATKEAQLVDRDTYLLQWNKLLKKLRIR